jgi:hypothetical protein
MQIGSFMKMIYRLKKKASNPRVRQIQNTSQQKCDSTGKEADSRESTFF